MVLHEIHKSKYPRYQSEHKTSCIPPAGFKHTVLLFYEFLSILRIPSPCDSLRGNTAANSGGRAARSSAARFMAFLPPPGRAGAGYIGNEILRYPHAAYLRRDTTGLLFSPVSDHKNRPE